MLELNVDSNTSRPQYMFDGLGELCKWYSAPTLSIFKRAVRVSLRKIDLNPREMALNIDDVLWVKEGLEIIEDRKKSSVPSVLVYSSSS